MIVGLVAKKLGMTSIYNENRRIVAVTVLQMLPCTVVANKTEEQHGYDAIVLGYGSLKQNRLTKAQKCVFTSQGLTPMRHLKEFRVHGKISLNVGDVVSLNNAGLRINQLVDVSGTTIGKGFSGVMKRYNFGGLEASHGVSASHRSGGSTGMCQDPGRVFKNKKMAGHQGAVKVTVQNLQVVNVDIDKNVIFVAGAIPGAKNSIVSLCDAIKHQSQQW